MPVWKSTYRILFDNKTAGTPGNKTATQSQTATLQGWAVVDNTVGSDWTNVQLSLIAGAPQSFLQPISQPYYNRRPEIGLPQEAQLTPQTHESGESKTQPQGTAGAGMGAGMGSGMGAAGGVMGGLASNSPAASANETVTVQANALSMNSQVTGGPLSRNIMVNGAPPAPIAYEDSASASITPNTQTASFDDFFEYKLTDLVTIRKNESALVPILQTKVDVDPVTLWSPGQLAPLRALWIRNTSTLTLDRGSFSILENGNFSGQGLLDPIHPGERRLLSYAADQAVRVSDDPTGLRNGQTRRVEEITISRGVLIEKAGEVVEHTYLVHNAAPEARTVIVEHPRRAGWELDSDPKPEETTPTLYRFRVLTGSNETVRLHVGERHTLFTRYEIASSNEEQLTVLLQQDGNPPAVLAALQPVFAAKRRLAGIDMQIQAKNAEMTTINVDQNRLRQNLAALKGSAEERALVKRYTGELNAQEDRLAAIKRETDALQSERAAAETDLSNKIEALNLDTRLS